MKNQKRSFTKTMLRITACVMLITFAIQLTSCKTAGDNLPESPKPQVQANLPKMLEFTWSKGPSMPQGLQDNAIQIIDNWIISVGGFCGGYDDDWKPGIYPRGFLNKVWGLNLNDESAGWKTLPPIPSIGRQGMVGVVVKNMFYVWGGCSYTAPFTHKDGYRLSIKNEKWNWDKLPDLPWALGWAGSYVIGSKIYILGGIDYDKERFYTETDRNGEVAHLGNRLIVIDTENLEAGWHELSPCPGSPRSYTSSAVIDGKIYSIGGIAASDSGALVNVVDCWSFDPNSNSWDRLRDFPTTCTGASQGNPVYKNRYILIPASPQYENYMKLGGSIEHKYGKPSKIKRTWENHPRVKNWHYSNHIYIYDVQTNLFGTANKLPYDDNNTPTIVQGDSLYMFPGETAGFVWDGEYFGHHPEFVMKGKIKELDWE